MVTETEKMKIHPTAFVDPTARLHDSVEVGAYSIIDANVSIGEGTRIGTHCRVYANAEIGKNNKIYDGVFIGCDPQHLAFDMSIPTRVVIGDGNIFREGFNVHRSTKLEEPTTIGNNNFFMGNVHIGHDCQVKDNNIMANQTAVGGHVTVGSRVFLSALVGVHQFVRIGDFAMVGGLAKVSRDIPPFTTVDGNPACVVGLNNIGLRRNGISKEIRTAIHRAYRTIYNEGLTTSQAVKKIKGNGDEMAEVDYLIRFFEESQRGVTDYDYDLVLTEKDREV